jgi:hypothetical protein
MLICVTSHCVCRYATKLRQPVTLKRGSGQAPSRYQSYSIFCAASAVRTCGTAQCGAAGPRQDAYGSPLTFSGGDSDTLMLALLRATYSGRNDAALAASVEQALPVQPTWLNFNRLRLRAERSVPLGAGVSAQLCGKGAPPPAPRLQTAAAMSGCMSRTCFPTPMLACLEVACIGQHARPGGLGRSRPPASLGAPPGQGRARPRAGGVIFGDLPPYEAFPIGGTNSVRGYGEGGVGSGRSFVAGTAELHYPIYGPVEVGPPAREPTRGSLALRRTLCAHQRGGPTLLGRPRPDAAPIGPPYPTLALTLNTR